MGQYLALIISGNFSKKIRMKQRKGNLSFAIRTFGENEFIRALYLALINLGSSKKITYLRSTLLVSCVLLLRLGIKKNCFKYPTLTISIANSDVEIFNKP